MKTAVGKAWAALGVALLVCLAIAAHWAAGPSGTPEEEILVAAASSLRPPLEQFRLSFTAHAHCAVQVSYGASGTLAEQILRGAPYDLFLSADRRHAEHVARLLDAPAEPLTYGTLVLWSARHAPHKLGAALSARSIPAGVRFALPHPDYAPYGRAAVQFLKRHGVYRPSRLVLAANVGQAAHYAVRGLVDAAFVSLSYARSGPLRTAGRYWIVPSQAYEPLPQTVVVLRRRPTVMTFVRWLRAEQNRSVWRRYGYRWPEAGKGP